MNNAKQLQIIFEPDVFIKEKYEELSPKWHVLTGKEQLEILTVKMPVQKVSFTLAPDADTGDATYKSAASMLSRLYVYTQSGHNSAVGDVLGLKEVTAWSE